MFVKKGEAGTLSWKNMFVPTVSLRTLVKRVATSWHVTSNNKKLPSCYKSIWIIYHAKALLAVTQAGSKAEGKPQNLFMLAERNFPNVPSVLCSGVAWRGVSVESVP